MRYFLKSCFLFVVFFSGVSSYAIQNPTIEELNSDIQHEIFKLGQSIASLEKLHKESLDELNARLYLNDGSHALLKEVDSLNEKIAMLQDEINRFEEEKRNFAEIDQKRNKIISLEHSILNLKYRVHEAKHNPEEIIKGYKEEIKSHKLLIKKIYAKNFIEKDLIDLERREMRPVGLELEEYEKHEEKHEENLKLLRQIIKTLKEGYRRHIPYNVNVSQFSIKRVVENLQDFIEDIEDNIEDFRNYPDKFIEDLEGDISKLRSQIEKLKYGTEWKITSLKNKIHDIRSGNKIVQLENLISSIPYEIDEDIRGIKKEIIDMQGEIETVSRESGWWPWVSGNSRKKIKNLEEKIGHLEKDIEDIKREGDDTILDLEDEIKDLEVRPEEIIANIELEIRALEELESMEKKYLF